MIVIAFLGCCGSVKESPCMLLAYCSLLIIVFSLQLVTGITAYAKRRDLKIRVNYSLHQALIGFDPEVWDTYHNGTKRVFDVSANDKNLLIDPTDPKYKKTLHTTKSVNFLQKTLKCCGIDSYKDWTSHKIMQNSPFVKFSKAHEKDSTKLKKLEAAHSPLTQNFFSVPESCCRNSSKNCGLNLHKKDKIYVEGCNQLLQRTVLNNFETLAVLIISISVFEFIGVLLSCSLWTQTKKTPYNVVDAMQARHKKEMKQGGR